MNMSVAFRLVLNKFVQSICEIISRPRENVRPGWVCLLRSNTMATKNIPTTMTAWGREAYGAQNLRWEQRPVPKPKAGEVLLRVAASSLNRGDHYRLTGTPWPLRFIEGLWRPKLRGLGMDVAGEVVVAGEGSRFRVGQRVFGEHLKGENWAPYAVMPEAHLAASPEGLSDEHAAMLPVAGLTALQGLRDVAKVEAGESVVINGATGAVGTMAVQVARILGARVTAVCRGIHRERMFELGAERVVAYDEEDYTEVVRDADVLFDGVMGCSLRRSIRCLRPKGRYLAVGGPEGKFLEPILPLVAAMLQAPFVEAKVLSFTQAPNPEGLAWLGRAVAEGTLKPAIARRFAMKELPEALRFQREGRPWAKLSLLA